MNEAIEILEKAIISNDWSSATVLIDYVIRNTDDFLTLDEINELIQYAKTQIDNGYPLRWFIRG